MVSIVPGLIPRLDDLGQEVNMTGMELRRRLEGNRMIMEGFSAGG